MKTYNNIIELLKEAPYFVIPFDFKNLYLHFRGMQDDYMYQKMSKTELNNKLKSKNIQVRFEAVPYNINGSRKIESLDIAAASHTPGPGPPPTSGPSRMR